MSSAEIRIVQTCYPKIYLACHTRHLRAASSPHRLSPRDSTLLAHLDERRPVRPTQLARHLGIGMPTVSAAVKRLRTLGYLDISINPDDRRQLSLTLTPAGAAAMRETSVLEPARVRSLFAALNADDRRRALRGLELLARAAHDVMTKGRQ
jgi:MarR family transcriptional regulator, organic hydroperoxide resistance regulator